MPVLPGDVTLNSDYLYAALLESTGSNGHGHIPETWSVQETRVVAATVAGDSKKAEKKQAFGYAEYTVRKITNK